MHESDTDSSSTQHIKKDTIIFNKTAHYKFIQEQ
jgi:hypothetical protein